MKGNIKMTKPRLILVPQLPTAMRYTEWWIRELCTRLQYEYSDIIILGQKYISSMIFVCDNEGSFFDISHSLDFETKQIQEYIELELKDDDVLLLNDISFPGLFSNVLYHKRPKNVLLVMVLQKINLIFLKKIDSLNGKLNVDMLNYLIRYL
jgi:hypothetical protein